MYKVNINKSRIQWKGCDVYMKSFNVDSIFARTLKELYEQSFPKELWELLIPKEL